MLGDVICYNVTVRSSRIKIANNYKEWNGIPIDHIAFKTIAMHFGRWRFPRDIDNFFVKIIAFLFLSWEFLL